MDGLRVIIKRYENQDKGIKFNEYIYHVSDYYGIYNKLMELTDNDHEEASNGASWCEFASVGEIYEFREGEIEIMDID